jgi:hypothetical protein
MHQIVRELPFREPDCVLLIANAISEVINSKPRSPSREEVQAVLRGGYFTVYVVMGGGTIENSREAIESAVAYRTERILSLINSRPRSPTLEEIKSVLR